MNKNKRWGITVDSDKPIHVVLFISRNKDNRNINNFHERRESFITTKNAADLELDFEAFVRSGRPGELSRMYYSVNARNSKKIHKALLHYLIDNPEFNLCSIQSKLAGIASTKECSAENHWLIDFDDKNISEFESDLNEAAPGVKYLTYTTVNGFAVVVDRGFDTRTLLNKWGSVATVKKDDLLLCMWGVPDVNYPEIYSSTIVSGRTYFKNQEDEIPY